VAENVTLEIVAVDNDQEVISVRDPILRPVEGTGYYTLDFCWDDTSDCISHLTEGILRVNDLSTG
jgi:hypothetical protein